jgi:tRNA(Ile)-lysidine synthase TilS/MesJ
MSKDFPNGKAGAEILASKVLQIKKRKSFRPRKYDVVIGISGGSDSAYLCQLATEQGLKVLAVHIDTGWNTEIAVENIKRTIENLKIDLFTIVVDWEEMKKIYISCMESAIPWIDGPTDLAITGGLYRAANKFKIKTIYVGNNFRTEGKQPNQWTNFDYRILKSVMNRSGQKISTFPKLRMSDTIYFGIIKKIKLFRPLNYLDYDKEKIKIELASKYGWRDYGGHHFESSFTKFTLSFWLPIKFDINKNKISLSAQIREGQIERAEAISNINSSKNKFESEDLLYVLQKLNISEKYFDSIMETTNEAHSDFKNYDDLIFKYPRISEFVIKKILGWKPMMFYDPKEVKINEKN